MRLFSASLAGVLLVLLASACGSGDGDLAEGTDEESSDALATLTPCTSNKNCATGFRCEVASGARYCRRTCGGFAALPCGPGQECFYDGNYPDALGVCKTAVVYDTCAVDSDCVAVSSRGCCSGEVVVNKKRAAAYSKKAIPPACQPSMCTSQAAGLRMPICESKQCRLPLIESVKCGGTTSSHQCPNGFACVVPAGSSKTATGTCGVVGSQVASCANVKCSQGTTCQKCKQGPLCLPAGLGCAH